MCLYRCCGLCLQFSFHIASKQATSLLMKSLADHLRHTVKRGVCKIVRASTKGVDFEGGLQEDVTIGWPTSWTWLYKRLFLWTDHLGRARNCSCGCASQISEEREVWGPEGHEMSKYSTHYWSNQCSFWLLHKCVVYFNLLTTPTPLSKVKDMIIHLILYWIVTLDNFI